MAVLYGVSQYNHGHEYRWIFTDEQIAQQTGEMPTEEIEGYDFWPMGGSNSSSTYAVRLDTADDVKDFLLGVAEPDSDDPMLVDVGEYYMTIETDDEYWGCVTGEWVKKLGIPASDLRVEEDSAGWRTVIEKIADYFREVDFDGFDYENPFYGDDCDMRVTELIDLYLSVDPSNSLALT